MTRIGLRVGRKQNSVPTNGRTTRSSNKACERPGRAPCARSGHFVTRVGLRVGAPDGRKQNSVPTNGRTTRSSNKACERPGPAPCARSGHFVIRVGLRVGAPDGRHLNRVPTIGTTMRSSKMACERLPHLKPVAPLRTNYFQLVALFNLPFQHRHRGQLPMHQKDLLQRRCHRSHPVQQLLLVRMSAQRVD